MPALSFSFEKTGISVSNAASASTRLILDAATTLFADHGFDTVSIASIAEKAGVCNANVFHHFRSKDELCIAVMKENCANHADYAEQLYHLPGGSADKVRMLIEFELHNAIDNRPRTKLILQKASGYGSARVRELARDIFQRNFTAVFRIFEQGRENGEFHQSIDPAAAAMLLDGVTKLISHWRGALSEILQIGETKTFEIYARSIVVLILTGILKAPNA
jgi:TetR/AcrR family transcriptional regulator